MAAGTLKAVLICCAVGFVLAGCQRPAPPIVLDPGDVKDTLGYDDLAVVLKAAVAEQGLLIPDALRKRADALDRQLRLLAAAGPASTPEQFTSRDDVLAYWYNARAAWSMKLALACNCPTEFQRSELTDRLFPLDGRKMSLDMIDHELSSDGDWRVVVAAPGVTLTRARLPDRPFSGKDIRPRIVEGVSQFVDDDRRFVIDMASQRVIVPRVIWQFRQRLLAEYRADFGGEGEGLLTALLPYVTGSAHRRLQDAIGYRLVPAAGTMPIALLADAWKAAL